MCKAYFIEKAVNFLSKLTAFFGGDGGDLPADKKAFHRKTFCGLRAAVLFVPSPPRVAQKNRYTNLRMVYLLFGGDGGDRTHDLLNAIQALSQLSYAPKKSSCL